MTEWDERRQHYADMLMEWAKRVMDQAGPCEKFTCEDKGLGFRITVEVTRVPE